MSFFFILENNPNNIVLKRCDNSLTVTQKEVLFESRVRGG